MAAEDDSEFRSRRSEISLSFLACFGDAGAHLDNTDAPMIMIAEKGAAIIKDASKFKYHPGELDLERAHFEKPNVDCDIECRLRYAVRLYPICPLALLHKLNVRGV